MASYYSLQLFADIKMKNYKNKISFVSPEGPKVMANKGGISSRIFIFNIQGILSVTDTINDFSVMLRTGFIFNFIFNFLEKLPEIEESLDTKITSEKQDVSFGCSTVTLQVI